MDARTIDVVAEFAVMILGYCAFSIAAILVHEIGHAVAGVCCGFRLLSLRVGLVRFQIPFSCSWEFRLTTLLTGDAVMDFRELPGSNAAMRAIGFVAGGPVMNIVAALALLPIAIRGTAFGNLCGVFLVMSLVVAVASTMPRGAGMPTSDGTKLLSLIFSEQRRGEILFPLTLRARMQEIITLCRAREFEAGLKKTDELLQSGASSPFIRADSEFHENLLKLKGVIEKGLAESENSRTDGSHSKS